MNLPDNSAIIENGVAVCLVTYNQEKYIASAIESVLMQQTIFPVQIIVGEDCSLDNTLAVCSKYESQYPGRIKIIYNQVNLGLVANTLSVLDNISKSNAKYIAMLDGDDYWTDPLKLQKQVDFLENNNDYGLVHTFADSLYANKKLKRDKRDFIPEGNVFAVMGTFFIANCTVVFRKKLLEYINGKDFIENKFMSCDYAMYVIFSKHTKFKFLGEHTAIWRRGHASVSNTMNKDRDIGYIENDIRMWKYLGMLFPERFGYFEKDIKNYRCKKIFKIAFRYGDYQLASSLVKDNKVVLANDLKGRVYLILMRYKVLFQCFYFLSKLKKYLLLEWVP